MVIRVCAAVIRDGRVLMVRHRHDGLDYWTLPGGGLEPGESPENGARREVREETGLSGEVTRLAFEREVRRGRRAGLERCFLFEPDDGQEPALGYDPEAMVGEEMLVEIGWFPLEELRDDVQVSRVLAALAQVPESRR